MAIFEWEALTVNGERRRGQMQAGTKAEVNNRIRGQAMRPLRVQKKARALSLNIELTPRRVNFKERVVFTRQFATMIGAGIPIPQALDTFLGSGSSPKLREIVQSVKTSIESGSSLAEAMRRHPEVFSSLYVNLVNAGEEGGVLDIILSRLATYEERQLALRRKIISALTYPSFVFAISILIVVAMFVFLVPQFEQLFARQGAALPLMTQAVLGLSRGLRENAALVTAGLLVLGGIGVAMFVTPAAIRVRDRIALRLPAVGPLLQKTAVSNFSRTLSTMLASGVNLLDALGIVAGTAGNTVVEEGLLQARHRVSQGSSLAVPLAEMSVFPQMVVEMVAVGETSGSLDTMLSKIADFYDDEVEAASTAAIALLEPLVIAMLVFLLGGLVVALYLPVLTSPLTLSGG